MKDKKKKNKTSGTDKADKKDPPHPSHSADPAPSASSDSLWRDRWFWGFMALACLTRLGTLTHPSLWFDEVRTLNIVQFEHLDHRIPHYGFHWIEQFFSALPLPADIALRLFPGLCGVTGIALVYVIAARLGGRAAGRWAGALVTLNATHWLYSQEARFYAPMFALAAGAWLATLTAFERRQWRWAPLAFALSAAACTIHPTQQVFLGLHAVFFAGALGLSGAGRDMLKSALALKDSGGRLRWTSVAACGVIAAGVIAALIYAPGFAKKIPAKFELNPAIWMRAFAPGFLSGHIRDYGAQFAPGLSCGGAYFFAFTAILVAGAVAGLRRWRRDAVWGLLTIFGTFIAIKAFKDDKAYEVKYSFFIFPFMTVFAAQGFETARAALARALTKNLGPQRAGLGAAIALGAVMAVFSLTACGQFLMRGKIETKSAMRRMLADWKPGDLAVSYGHTSHTMSFYWDLWNEAPERRVAIPWEDKDSGACLSGRVEALRRLGGDVWFIDSWLKDDPAGMRKWLETHGELVETWPGVLDQPVHLYRFPAEPALTPPFKIEAAECLPERQPSRPYATEIGGRMGLTITINGGFDYKIEIPEAGDYTLEVEGLNSGGVFGIWQVETGGRTQGELVFEPGADTWSKRRMRLALEAGSHTLTLRWLGDSLTAGKGAKIRAALGSIALTPGFEGRNDNAAPQMGFLKANSDPIELAPGGTLPGLQSAWNYKGDWPLKVESPNAIQIDIPAGAKPKSGVRLVGKRPLTVPPGEFLYIEAEASSREMFNHSCFLQVLFIDGRGQTLGGGLPQRAGLSDSLRFTPFMDETFRNEWVKLGGVVHIPPSAAAWIPIVTVSPQGRQLSRAGAQLRLRNLRQSPVKTEDFGH